MNQTEFELLSKEDIFKMYENVCEELEEYESISQAGCDSCDEFSSELYELEAENDSLRYEIQILKNALDRGECNEH